MFGVGLLDSASPAVQLEVVVYFVRGEDADRWAGAYQLEHLMFGEMRAVHLAQAHAQQLLEVAERGQMQNPAHILPSEQAEVKASDFRPDLACFVLGEQVYLVLSGSRGKNYFLTTLVKSLV